MVVMAISVFIEALSRHVPRTSGVGLFGSSLFLSSLQSSHTGTPLRLLS